MRRRPSERRKHPRHAIGCSLSGDELPFLGAGEGARIVSGSLRDLGVGGLGVWTDLPLQRERLLRCELRFPGVPVAIPTLAQVRWSAKAAGSRKYLSGLQFFF